MPRETVEEVSRVSDRFRETACSKVVMHPSRTGIVSNDVNMETWGLESGAYCVMYCC